MSSNPSKGNDECFVILSAQRKHEGNERQAAVSYTYHSGVLLWCCGGVGGDCGGTGYVEYEAESQFGLSFRMRG